MVGLGGFAPDGTPIDLEEWERLFALRAEDLAPESWWRKRTEVEPGVEVSTVWIGLTADGSWEGMIFGGAYDEWRWRYASREEALDDHERLVRALREGRNPAEAADHARWEAKAE